MTTVSESHVAFTCIEFTDGTCTASLIHRGDLESCRDVAELFSAIMYSGEKTPLRSTIAWMPTERWEQMKESQQ